MSHDFPPQTRPVPPSASAGTSRSGDTPARALGTSSGGGRVYEPYPSPFSTLSGMDLPTDIKGLFRICRNLVEWSPTHRAYVRMMSTLPVTDLVFKPTFPTSDALRGDQNPLYGTVTSDNVAVSRLDKLARHNWRLRRVGQEVARSFFTVSNAAAYISYPFHKLLGCVHCRHRAMALYEKWELRPYGSFYWQCPKCGKRDTALVIDHFVQVPEDVRLIPLDMEIVDAVKNEYRDDVDLYMQVPPATVQRLSSNPLDKEFICTIPQAVLEAAHGKQRFPHFTDATPRVKLRKDQVYFMRAATLPRSDEGFAFPEMAATFQDYWLRKTQQKSQEAIHTEMATLKRFVFPDGYGQADSLMQLVNLGNVQDKIRTELATMRRDPGYIGVLPFKMGQSLVGGEAKIQSLAQDIKVQVELEAAGLGTPIEALFGGMQFSGASVSVKQVEAGFEDFRSNLLDMYRWFIDSVSASMRLPRTAQEMKPFRMGEDIPHVQMLASLYAQGAVSLRHLHTALNLDTHTERKQIAEDAQFVAGITKVRGKADAANQEELTIRGAAAMAQGEVAGMEASLDARAELARKVRSDKELYSIVTQDPQLAAQILGPSSEEAQAGSMMQAVPAPPAGDGGGAGELMTPEMMEQFLQGYGGGDDGFSEDMGEAAVDNAQPAYGPPGV